MGSCKLGQGQGTAPDCEDAENDTIDDDDETTRYDTKEEACDETAPAVTDVEPSGDYVEDFEDTRRGRAAEDCYWKGQVGECSFLTRSTFDKPSYWASPFSLQGGVRDPRPETRDSRLSVASSAIAPSFQSHQ
jgi:hypothetical protein